MYAVGFTLSLKFGALLCLPQMLLASRGKEIGMKHFWIKTIVSLVLAASSMLPLAALASSAGARASAAVTTWKTFHDPLYGFSLSYPDTWILAPEQNGSRITLLNPATQTAISPLVTAQAGTPADYLKQARAAAGVKNP